MDFLRLDPGAWWTASHIMRSYLRQGKVAQAREAVQKFSENPLVQLSTSCMDGATPASTARLARSNTDLMLRDPDPEVRYWYAPDLIYCGHPDLAYELLRSAVVTGHYCAYDGLRNDSVFAPLRNDSQFAEILTSAKQCRDSFLAERAKAAP